MGLFEYLKTIKPTSIIIPASIASNHLITSLTYCENYALKAVVFTKKPYGPLRANAQAVLAKIEPHYCQDPFLEGALLAQKNKGAFLMPLGGFHKEAARSALSLGEEIALFNEQTPLEHLFLDAGTGLQAAAALIALQGFDYRGEAHVVCMGPLDFKNVLETVAKWLHLPLPTFKIHIHTPIIGKRYGSFPKELQEFSEDFYQKTGILLDPYYNAKLFHTASVLMKQNKVTGTVLLVHSGGTYSATTSG